MSHALRIALIALGCALQMGLSPCWGASVAPTGTDPSDPAPPGKTGFPDSRIGAPQERWKACVQQYYPTGVPSASELQSHFQRPQNVSQLLQNLKQAWEQELLLQPSFYDPTILQKFFAGTAVRSTEPYNPLTPDVGFVVLEFDSTVVQGMTVRLESRCWQTDRKSTSGREESIADLLGALTISGGPFAVMTLRAVRDVFGPETENDLDSGGVELGVVYGPLFKGSVLYTDRSKEKAEGGLALGTTFVFPRQPSQGDPKLVDEDIVQSIRMREQRHRLLEN